MSLLDDYKVLVAAVEVMDRLGGSRFVFDELESHMDDLWLKLSDEERAGLNVEKP